MSTASTAQVTQVLDARLRHPHFNSLYFRAHPSFPLCSDSVKWKTIHPEDRLAVCTLQVCCREYRRLLRRTLMEITVLHNCSFDSIAPANGVRVPPSERPPAHNKQTKNDASVPERIQ